MPALPTLKYHPVPLVLPVSGQVDSRIDKVSQLFREGIPDLRLELVIAIVVGVNGDEAFLQLDPTEDGFVSENKFFDANRQIEEGCI